MHYLALVFTIVVACSAANSNSPSYVALPSVREQAEEQQKWIDERVNVILPKLMQQYNAQFWLLPMREYAEDPVFWAVSAPTKFSARRITVLAFFFNGTTFSHQQFIGIGQDVWTPLTQLLQQINPSKVHLNVDPVWAFSDGLHTGIGQTVTSLLGFHFLCISNHKDGLQIPYEFNNRLAIDLIAIRSSGMLERYKQIMENVHYIIGTAFSNEVITPGVTTTDDVVWWFRQTIQDYGMTTWFQPDVQILLRDNKAESISGIIQPGDVLWCDFGVVAMGMATDTQHVAYVLKSGEKDAPEGLKACLKASNRLQDIVLEEMKIGRTGNEVLNVTKSRMAQENIQGTIYCHPIGDYGHSAGPLIGLWDHQEGVPVRGDVPIVNSTWFSIELSSSVAIAEFNNVVLTLPQEEDIYLYDTPQWVYKRQSEFHLIETKSTSKTLVIIIGILVPLVVVSIIGAMVYLYKRNMALFKYEKVATDEELKEVE